MFLFSFCCLRTLPVHTARACPLLTATLHSAHQPIQPRAACITSRIKQLVFPAAMPLRTLTIELWHLDVNNSKVLAKHELLFTKYDNEDTLRAAIIEKCSCPAGSVKFFAVSWPDKDVYEYSPLSNAAVVGCLKQFCATGDATELFGLMDNSKLPLAFTAAPTSSDAATAATAGSGATAAPAAAGSDATAAAGSGSGNDAGGIKKKRGRGVSKRWRNRLYELATDNMPRHGDGTFILRSDRRSLGAGKPCALFWCTGQASLQLQGVVVANPCCQSLCTILLLSGGSAQLGAKANLALMPKVPPSRLVHLSPDNT